MPRVNTTAKLDYASGQLRQVGGNDADVYTKPGRHTDVELRTNNIRVSDAGNAILLDIFYSVREGVENGTQLEWNGTAELPVPVDAHSHTITVQDARNYNQSWIVQGENHEWNQLDSTAGTVIEPNRRSGGRSGQRWDPIVFTVPISYSVP
jgi:hypothetical protein